MPSTEGRTAATATVTWLRPAAGHHTYVVDARCATCERAVLHSAGDDLAALVLGVRRTHCKCPGTYELVDPDDVLATRAAALRTERGSRTSRRPVSA